MAFFSALSYSKLKELVVLSTADIFRKNNIKINNEGTIKEELGIKEKDKAQKPVMAITKAISEQAVREALVPQVYQDREYDRNIVKKNVEKNIKMNKRAVKVYNLEKYLDLLDEILATVRSGQKPKGSYIIGAPNGFGKTTFANTLLKVMLARGWRVAPYVSLTELAEIRLAAEDRIMGGLTGFVRKKKSKLDNEEFNYDDVGGVYKEPEIVITNKFSWSEYLNTDVLIVYLTDVASRQLESNLLKSLLEIRGTKGLPTIVMTSNSLNYYTKDNILGPRVWDEILTKEELRGVYDRVQHVSTYKMNSDII